MNDTEHPQCMFFQNVVSLPSKLMLKDVVFHKPCILCFSFLMSLL